MVSTQFVQGDARRLPVAEYDWRTQRILTRRRNFDDLLVVHSALAFKIQAMRANLTIHINKG